MPRPCRRARKWRSRTTSPDRLRSRLRCNSNVTTTPDMQITHHFSSREYAKETLLPIGSEVPQHAHTHDHLAILAAGRALVEVDGVETRYHGPCCIVIGAGK